MCQYEFAGESPLIICWRLAKKLAAAILDINVSILMI